jgi:hypothetical protein
MVYDDQQHYEEDYYNESPLQPPKAPEPKPVKPKKQKAAKAPEPVVPKKPYLPSRFDAEFPFEMVIPPQQRLNGQLRRKLYNPKASVLYQDIVGEVLTFKPVDETRYAAEPVAESNSADLFEDELPELPTDVARLKQLIVTSVQQQVKSNESRLKKDQGLQQLQMQARRAKRVDKSDRKKQRSFESLAREAKN